MTFLVLLLIGVLVGVTTVVFGFGGGFVAVPLIAWADHALGGEALRVATATSLLVMVGNAAIATAATPRSTLAWLAPRRVLLGCLAIGGLLGAVAAPGLPGAWVRWAFVAYIGATFVDLVLRRGFVRTRPVAPDAGADGEGRGARHAIPAPAGVLIGAVATLLGVGGSVMTVPALRRAGAPMAQATALANPLTLAIVVPAAVLTLATGRPVPGAQGMVGSVDVFAAAALLVSALPVIVVLRRRPLPLPDRVHAIGYLALLVASGAAVAAT
ncbi:TSUP family transporter [Streptomyces sp. NPDC054765]